MDNLDSDKYYETLLNNFAKNYQYYLNLKAKTKNPINIFIKKKNELQILSSILFIF